MTKEEIVVKLDKKVSLSLGSSIKTVWTKTTNGESTWSRSFAVNDTESVSDFLKKAFEIQDEQWEEHFKEATTGEGNEINRILTLHSSALLAFLCFCSVSKSKPLTITHKDGETVNYIKCMFEVKNKVFKNPSCIDVLLISEKGDRLYLESKFTEYFDQGSPNISMEYFPFYLKVLSKLKGKPLQLVYPHVWKEKKKHKDKEQDKEQDKDKEQDEEIIGFTIQPKSKKKDYQNLYLSGIKQCLSHIIGILNGPVNEQTLHQTDDAKLRFGTILYKHPTVFPPYRDFYNETIGQITPEVLYEGVKDTSISQTRIKQTHIIENVLTYQDVFKNNNKNFLPKKVKQFYDL